MSDYYAANAEDIYQQYQSLDARKVHASWLKFLPESPGIAADIGAGSGRDSYWLASMGWEVIAVEPSKELRQLAKSNPAGNVTWIDDKLPDLAKLRTIGYRFNLILLSAVWMHLPESQRQRAFRILSDLLAPGGLLVITLRHGSDERENLQRNFHPVSADELMRFSAGRALQCIHQDSQGDLLGRNQGVEKLQWETLVFRFPDDGTGCLPLLRHIIVNDDKSATYKLGLLRALVRIADGAPGIVQKRADDFVELPFGVVGLYWLKLYMPLVLKHGLMQAPSHKPEEMTGLGFAKPEHFYRLSSLSPFDLRIGVSIAPEDSSFVIGAIRDACRHIQRMPAHFISYPGTQKNVFECNTNGFRIPKGRWQINKESLASFGTFVVPARLWQTLGQYACWLEPAILNEWARLMMGYELRYDRSVYDKALEWDEGVRDTGLVRSRVDKLLTEGRNLQCVWTDVKLKSPSFQIDHCFPWSRWFNNDLWNLLPTSNSANSMKGDKLPSAALMNESRDRILGWWEDAYVRSEFNERFHIEAEAALPLLGESAGKLDSVYDAMLFQRAKIKMNQQLSEWG